MIEWVHPAFLLIFGSLLVPLLRGGGRKVYLLALSLAAILSVVAMSQGVHGQIRYLGLDLIFGRVDKLSLVFAYVFTIMCFIGVLYSLQVKESGHSMAALIYVGSTLGVTFAGDYFTLFVFWEIMAFSSVFLIWYQRSQKALEAGLRYLMIHAVGGLVLLGGILLYVRETGSMSFGHVEGSGWGQTLILIGFILNAAVVPLSAWLSDAYPEATVGGAVFLSAFTTKSAVYVLARAFPGTEILIWLGAIMALYGVVYAVLENDIRRLLAYHIISQVGYMVAGVGIGTAMAINGAVAHAFSHILYKGLLFMGAGSVIHMTGRRKLTELGGLYKTMPLTFLLYMVGGLSISAFPLFSGFVSKSMVIAASGEQHRTAIWLMLTMASSGTFLHTGLKLPYFTFYGKDAGIEGKEPPWNMLFAMGIAAFLCVFIGVFPGYLYTLLPFPVDFEPYTATHVIWTLEILMFTLWAFFLLVKLAGGKPVISLDTDWFYRMASRAVFWVSSRPVATWEDRLIGWAHITLVERPTEWISRVAYFLDVKVIDGLVDGLGSAVLGMGQSLRRIQTGLLPHYAFYMAGGAVVIVTVYLFL